MNKRPKPKPKPKSNTNKINPFSVLLELDDMDSDNVSEAIDSDDVSELDESERKSKITINSSKDKLPTESLEKSYCKCDNDSDCDCDCEYDCEIADQVANQIVNQTLQEGPFDDIVHHLLKNRRKHQSSYNEFHCDASLFRCEFNKILRTVIDIDSQIKQISILQDDIRGLQEPIVSPLSTSHSLERYQSRTASILESQTDYISDLKMQESKSLQNKAMLESVMVEITEDFMTTEILSSMCRSAATSISCVIDQLSKFPA